ncbi:MAG: CD3324 family protein [Clostridiaceae bacterium]|nr:CD3324 family protein [Clostridiaceae bacterium]
MAYINAKEVLPKELLKEVQKYFYGGTMYVPDSSSVRKEWGSNTNTKSILKKRNNEIKMKKHKGASIYELMEEYNLSYDSIKKIIYSK